MLVSMMTGHVSTNAGSRLIGGKLWNLRSLEGKHGEALNASLLQFADAVDEDHYELQGHRYYGDFVPNLSSAITNFSGVAPGTRVTRNTIPALVDSAGSGAFTKVSFDMSDDALLLFHITLKDVEYGINVQKNNVLTIPLLFNECEALRTLALRNVKSSNVTHSSLLIGEGRFRVLTRSAMDKNPRYRAIYEALTGKDYRLAFHPDLPSMFSTVVLDAERPVPTKPQARVSSEVEVVKAATDDTPEVTKVKSTVRLGGRIVIRKRPE